jgi:hypothetical protein
MGKILFSKYNGIKSIHSKCSVTIFVRSIGLIFCKRHRCSVLSNEETAISTLIRVEMRRPSTDSRLHVCVPCYRLVLMHLAPLNGQDEKMVLYPFLSVEATRKPHYTSVILYFDSPKIMEESSSGDHGLGVDNFVWPVFVTVPRRLLRDLELQVDSERHAHELKVQIEVC